MDEKINIRQALEAFHIIYEQGVKKDDYTLMNGIRAQMGFDGYTLSLSNDYVSLELLFHNRFSLSYSSRSELAQFIDRLDTIRKTAGERRAESTAG